MNLNWKGYTTAYLQSRLSGHAHLTQISLQELVRVCAFIFLYRLMTGDAQEEN